MKFNLQGKLYQFTFLPNGSCSDPRKFTKLLKPPLAPLRLDYIKIVAYIDDLITLAYLLIQYVLQKCMVHPEKSVFVPSQEMEYVGFIYN